MRFNSSRSNPSKPLEDRRPFANMLLHQLSVIEQNLTYEMQEMYEIKEEDWQREYDFFMDLFIRLGADPEAETF